MTDYLSLRNDINYKIYHSHLKKIKAFPITLTINNTSLMPLLILLDLCLFYYPNLPALKLTIAVTNEKRITSD